jgi:hypothetical protein
LKPDGHEQTYPFIAVLLLVQVPFLHGFIISHGVFGTLQRVPIYVESLQDFGLKKGDVGSLTKAKNKKMIEFKS